MKSFFIVLALFLSLIFSGIVYAEADKINMTFGIIDTDLGVTPTEIVEAVKPFQSYISEHLNCETKVVIIHTVPDMIEALKQGKIDFAYVSNLDYIRIKQALDITPLVMVVKAGSKTYKSLFIVRGDSNFNNISQLQGKKFIYTDRNSAHGYIFPNLYVRKNYNKPLEEFFGQTITGKKDCDSILAVLYKKADVASVSNQTLDIMAQLKPRLSREIKTLNESQPFVQGPIFCYKKNFSDESFIKRFTDELLKMDKITEGKQTLLLFKIGGWTPAKDEDYNSLRSIFRQVF